MCTNNVNLVGIFDLNLSENTGINCRYDEIKAEGEKL
jgi:hypothetical protein